MYSVELESFSNKDFIDLVNSAASVWQTDVIYSGEGYPGEGESVCYVMAKDKLAVTPDTSLDEIKEFAFSDEREVLGWLSYEYGMLLRGVKPKESYIELGMLKKYEAYIRHSGERLIIESSNSDLLDKIVQLQGHFSESAPAFITDVKCNMEADDYIDKAGKVLEYIKSGHTYQLNLSMKFEGSIRGRAFDLWREFALKNPAPFYAYMESECGEIVSTSPERFLKVANGNVLSQPIKGTHRFEEYEEGIERILTESVKESAELSMIVDLIRNDISEHCEIGSVKVRNHKTVMRVDNLLQMYSDVEGRLKESSDVIDLLVSASPGGSITGCPKKRSMEIINELEPHSRGIYCGSIFRIKDRENMDSSITIRTAFVEDGKIIFFAGSGIVAASEPEKEYYESVSKAEKFMRKL